MCRRKSEQRSRKKVIHIKISEEFKGVEAG
jgi:hypothetical protein